MNLPDHFRWGVATSAYQIEGAVAEDGRTDSIWDTFCRVRSNVVNGETGEVACDHYHRMPEDVALMRSLGIGLYRFSVSWPRVQPGGRGALNPRGIAFYDRLVDELLASGIEPWITLYHWDLPQELEDAGGWPVRDTAFRFADYAWLVHERLGDRIPTWTTLNEPWCSAMLGYGYGRHAPGRRDLGEAYAAAHHLLLGHGLAASRLRFSGASTLGISLNLGGHEPYSGLPEDVDAARRADGSTLRLYLNSLVLGAYPADVVEDLAAQGIQMPILDGDLSVISTPLDLIGVNYYSSQVHRGDRVVPTGRPVTAMGWEIVPEGLTKLLVRLSKDYPGIPLWITENGAAFDDIPDDNGFVDDTDRVAYLRSHISAVAEACRQGADVRGYFAWSLLDNFEWAEGYSKRFGLVRVDYPSQRRIPKQSAHMINWKKKGV